MISRGLRSIKAVQQRLEPWIAPKLIEAGGDADAYTNDTYHFICEYYRDRADAQFAFPEPGETLRANAKTSSQIG